MGSLSYKKLYFSKPRNVYFCLPTEKAMEAVVTESFEEATVREVSNPEISEAEVLISVDRVQLSVTECLLFQGKYASKFGGFHERVSNGGALAFGHEFCGTVEEVGSAVSHFTPGDRVYAPNKSTCGSCAYCSVGYSEYCTNRQTLGIDRPGALAEYVAAPVEMLQALPDSISDAEGAAMQPLAAAAVCVHDAEISSGETVAVVGSGVMGHQCAQLARYSGAKRIIAIDIDKQKINIAAKQGFDAVDASDRDPVKYVRKVTNGIGADVVFEAVGGEQQSVTDGDDPLAQAYQMTRIGGRLIPVSHMTSSATLDISATRTKSIRLIFPQDRVGIKDIGPNTDTGNWAVSMVESDAVPIEEFITHELSGLDSFRQAIEITSNPNKHGALGPAQMIID
jgi:threonine dehydrogenase-like Zn-dependent dehydrogenase